MSPETLKNYIQTFRSEYPILFKDAETEEAFSKAMLEAGRSMVGNISDLVVDRIGQGISDFAAFDVGALEKEGLHEEELSLITSDPKAYVTALLVGTWNVAMELIQDIGFGGLDVKRALEGMELAKDEDDMAFTSREVGQA